MKRKDLHQPFFPAEIFEDYFNPKRKKKGTPFDALLSLPTTNETLLNLDKKKLSKKQKLDTLADPNLFEDEKAAGSSDKEGSDTANSQGAGSDYDVDEEYDNDYAENYFDNGEGDDADDLGDGGGGDGGGE